MLHIRIYISIFISCVCVYMCMYIDLNMCECKDSWGKDAVLQLYLWEHRRMTKERPFNAKLAHTLQTPSISSLPAGRSAWDTRKLLLGQMYSNFYFFVTSQVQYEIDGNLDLRNHIDNFFLFSWELKKVSVIGRHLGSLTAANWVSFDFNVAYSSRWGYSLINTLKSVRHSMITVSAMVQRSVPPLHNMPRQPSIGRDAVTASRPDGLGRRLLQSVQVCLSSCVRHTCVRFSTSFSYPTNFASAVIATIATCISSLSWATNWRPLSLACLCALVALLFSYFLQESPPMTPHNDTMDWRQAVRSDANITHKGFITGEWEDWTVDAIWWTLVAECASSKYATNPQIQVLGNAETIRASCSRVCRKWVGHKHLVYTYTRKYTYTLLHTHTQMHSFTHTHTQTHTHTYTTPGDCWLHKNQKHSKMQHYKDKGRQASLWN